MTTAQLLVRIKGDGSGLQQTIGKAKSQLSGFQKFAAGGFGLGGLGLGGVLGGVSAIGFGKGFLDWSDNIGAVADRLGLTTDMVQKLNYVASQTDTSLESLAAVVKKLSLNAETAIAKNGAMRDGFAALGLTTDKLSKMTQEQLVIAFFNAASKIKDVRSQLVLLNAIGGKTATQILPTINENLGQMFDRIDKRGGIINERDIRNAKKFNDTLAELWILARARAVQTITGVFKEPERVTGARITMTGQDTQSSKVVELLSKIEQNTAPEE